MIKDTYLDYDFIYNLYIIKNYSINQIHEITNINKTIISNSIHKYNITKSKKSRYEARTKVTKERNLEKYGDENYNNINKQKDTIFKKYGVNNVSQIDFVKEKKKQTCFNNFGVDYPSQSPSWRAKINEYYQKNFGCNRSTERAEYWDLVDKDTWLSNQFSTKRKNNTFKSSKSEKLCYKLLTNIYKENNIYYQYRCNKYPFNCDFYIESDDLFIELNFHWTHGGKPYDVNNPECQKQLELWKEKVKTSQFYKNAIETWTVRDVEKQRIAKKNNLNYLLFYSKKDFDTWIQTKI